MLAVDFFAVDDVIGGHAQDYGVAAFLVNQHGGKDQTRCGVTRRRFDNYARAVRVGDLPCAVNVFRASDNEDVLWLEVSVHHHVAVAVLHPRDDLLEEPASIIFIQLCT